MNALRLHKGTVPGREKLRDARRLLQASRQRAARGSLLQGLRSFLTADSFMYGPLLQEQQEQSLTPTPVHHLSDDDDLDNRDHHDSEPRTPDGGSTEQNQNEGETSAGKNGEDNGFDETPRRYQGSRSTKTSLTLQRTTRTSRAVVPPAADGSGSRTPTSTARVITNV